MEIVAPIVPITPPDMLLIYSILVIANIITGIIRYMNFTANIFAPFLIISLKLLNLGTS